jgi:hypothetical protein
MDARIKSGHDGCVLWGEANKRFAHTTTSQFSNSKTNPNMRSLPRGAVRPSRAFISRPHGGRGECRVPAAPAVSRALCIGRTHTSNNEYTGTPGIPARNGFNGLCRALPGDRALLPPSSRGLRNVRARLGRHASAKFDTSVGASGPHDFAVRSNISRQRAGESLTSLSTCPAIPSRARRCRVHRIPRLRP